MSPDDLDRWALLDERADLENGFTAAWCIGPDGSPWPWIVARHSDPHGYDGCRCEHCAPHEQPGPLPGPMAGYVADVLDRPTRCGGTTTTGHPCRVLVTRAGRRCRWHRTTTTSTHHDRTEPTT